MTEKLTVMQVFEKTADKFGDKTALRVKRGGTWKETSWSGYRDEVRLAAKAFIKLGLEPGRGVSIVGANCPQWHIADLAAIYAGGRPAGVYTTNSAEQCKYVASHSETEIAVVENEVQLAKFLEIRDELANFKAIVLMYGDSSEDNAYAWPEFLKLGEEADNAELDKRIEAQDPDDVCTYIYTSGTTGEPKAVMISHDNITWTARAALESLGAVDDDHMLSYLPLSHIAEQIVSLHGPMVAGATVSFAESMEKLGDNLREIRPTIFLGVPRVWEKIQAKIQAAAAANPSGLQKKIGAWARKVGLKGGYADQTGEARPLFYGLAEKLVYTKVRERLGLDRCRVAVTSAAPISQDTLEFFLSLGVPLMEVYGMSECAGPTTTSLPTAYKTTFVGRKLDGTGLKIADDGEICMRGRHVFKGYFKNEAATTEALDDEGWLHSGDIGEIDSRGFLKITDRKKDLIITAGGENVAPQLIEGKLKSIPWVSQAVVVGDRQKHLSALLTLDETKLDDAIAQAGSNAKTMEEAADDKKVAAWLLKEVNKINADLARVQTIKKIKVLPVDLSIDGGELTPTMKVRRKVVNKKYQSFIDGFYGA
ncbi:MAG: AMP-binding protein [Nannocystaceae bacterium]|nr:AMP-binding protein [Nannocystaceae bacterium]